MAILDVIFPKKCAGCDRLGDYICSDCLNKIKLLDNSICPICVKLSMWGNTHTRCKRPWGLDGLTATFVYKGLMKKLIRNLKYRMITDLYQVLVESMISMGDYEPIQNHSWIISGVPLHPRRLRWRGFNQADKLGIRLAQEWHWNFIKDTLKRTKYTKSQMGLPKKERLQNMQGAFDIDANFYQVNKKQVLLVDDVWTTGATMRECAKVLKRNGAKKVWGLVIAR